MNQTSKANNNKRVTEEQLQKLADSIEQERTGSIMTNFPKHSVDIILVIMNILRGFDDDMTVPYSILQMMKVWETWKSF